ncbi:MAG: adenylate cyclase [Actinomycetota bacterium]|jgi:adenylate cyclase
MSDDAAAFHPTEARAFLRAKGLAVEEIDEAEDNGTLHLLVLDWLLLPHQPRYTQAEVAEQAGLSLEEAQRFWRALGFPDVAPDEVAFTDHDLNALTTVTGLIHLGLTDVEVALQLARVTGQSMARIADSAPRPALTPEDSARFAELFALTGGATLDGQARLLDYVWRRHLQQSLRRHALRRTGDEVQTSLAVGFADLVGFTALSQQLSEAALSEVVSRFEELAYDTVAAGGGRVVKMIGDEVMFVTGDVTAAARIALSLSDAYGGDEQLSDVRVGLACGPVLAREGDYYGPVVNLASRIVNIARPGSVLISAEVVEGLADESAFQCRSLRSRYLKDLGRVPVSVLEWSEAVLEDDDAGEVDGDVRGRRRRRRGPGVFGVLSEQVRQALEVAGREGERVIGGDDDD